MADYQVSLTDEEAAAVALELATGLAGDTPEAWLKDHVSWALAPAVDRYRIVRANTVLTALAEAPAGSSVADVQEAITDRVSQIGGPVPVKLPPTLTPVVAG